MNTEKKFGALSSSVDGSQLSLTISAILKMIAGLLAALGLGVILPDVQTIQDQVQALTQLGIQAAPLIYAAWNSAEAIFGAFRKILAYFFSR